MKMFYQGNVKLRIININIYFQVKQEKSIVFMPIILFSEFTLSPN